MIKTCFNHGWDFTFENHIDEFSTWGFDKYSDAAGAPTRFLDYNHWQRVDLPHDWALSLEKNILANTFAGAYPNTSYHRFMTERHSEIQDIYHVGWYRKQFAFDPAWTGKRIFLEFEGIFRDSIIWVNGVYLDRHNSGYTSFVIEITDHLVENEDNSIAVRVDSDQPEGWWYEGAGIYRNVNLLIGEPTYFKYNQTIVKAETDGKVQATAILVNDTADAVDHEVVWEIVSADGQTVFKAESSVPLQPYSETKITQDLKIDFPILWNIDTPYLYTLKATVDEEKTSVRFGIRSIVFDANGGLLINGIPQKVRGACVHQDFGGVGVALTDNLQYYKIKRLKEMGVNAYRTSHHAPSPVLLDACDELGMLVMDETRMFGTSPEAIRQLTDLIERDRNHPCVFIWALGNEEFSIQNQVWSYLLMKKMTRIAKNLDSTRPVTYGGCNGANFVGVNGAAEIRGVNYIRNDRTGEWLDGYHTAHPEQPIIGTEESSYVLSRGGAVNDLKNGLLDATGTVTMPWGSTPKGWVKFMEERKYFAGSFMWTGFDYRGEPNPFYYENCVSSFGTIDLCGMEKPPFYYYKAWWTDEPVLKLSPHWNHKEGDTVTVAVFTNCEQITLSVNGRILETRPIERYDAPLFKVTFEPGVLAVDGIRDGQPFHDELVTSGDTTKVICTSVLNIQNEDDIGIYELNAYDDKGVFCPLAHETVEIMIENGEIVGVGNGDPSSFSYERKPATEKVRLIREFEENGHSFFIPAKIKNHLPDRKDWFRLENKETSLGFEDDFRVVAEFQTSFVTQRTRVLTSVIDDSQGYEYIEFERLGGKARVYLNGELIGHNLRWYGRQTRTGIRPYRFYANFAEDKNIIRVVFEEVADDDTLMSGYVKLGKRLHEPWQVKLHYGKARVFVKSRTPDQLKFKVKIEK